MKQKVKRVFNSLWAGLLLGILIRILIPVSTGFMFSVVVFTTTLNIFLEEFEKDVATKRLFKKILLIGAGVLGFLGLRIAFGHIFNMPLINSFNDLKAVGVAGMTATSGPEALILELLFLIPGGGFAYALAVGGTYRKLAYLLSILMFFIVLWQVKQVEHSAALARAAQAKIEKQANSLQIGAAKDETAAASSWGTPLTEIKIFYNLSSGVLEETPLESLVPGEYVKVLEINQPLLSYQGELFYKIQLQHENGSYVNSPIYYVQSNLLNVGDGYTRYPLPEKNSGETRVTAAKKGWQSLNLSSTPIFIGIGKKGQVIRWRSENSFFVKEGANGTPTPLPAGRNKGDIESPTPVEIFVWSETGTVTLSVTIE